MKENDYPAGIALLRQECLAGACSGSRRARVIELLMIVTDETAMRLLRATREQLHSEPTREIKPFEVAEQVGINPYQYEYDAAMRYLIGNGYLEPYLNPSHGLYRRMTNKGIEALLRNP
jgi:hypothetical protein